jgi:DNA-binding response OmpR family regulator
LLVDDDQDVVDVCALLLAWDGHECRTATNGRAALEELDRFVPDIVILDIELGDTTGYAIAAQIRARLGRSVFLAAVSGRNSSSDIAQMYTSGFDQQVVKPTDNDKLRDIVRTAEAAAAKPKATAVRIATPL